MFENKSSLALSAAIILAALIIGAALLLVANKMAFKVATVDVNEIFKKSEVGDRLNKEMSNKMKEIQGKLNLAKTETEKNELRMEYEKFKAAKESDFIKQVKEKIAKVAKQKGVKAVASPQVYVYSELDITDDVIKALDK